MQVSFLRNLHLQFYVSQTSQVVRCVLHDRSIVKESTDPEFKFKKVARKLHRRQPLTERPLTTTLATPQVVHPPNPLPMTHLSRTVLTTMAIKSGQDSGNEDVDDEEVDHYSEHVNVFDTDFDVLSAHVRPNDPNNPLSNTISSCIDDDEIQCDNDSIVNSPAVSGNAALRLCCPPARLLASNSSAVLPPERLPSSRDMDPNDHSIARQKHSPSVDWI